MKKKKLVIYVIGSLRNKNVPIISNKLRKSTSHEIFDSWYSPGPHADDYWRHYEKAKGVTYKEALRDWAAKHIFEFDVHHLDRADVVVLIMPAGCCKTGLPPLATYARTIQINLGRLPTPLIHCCRYAMRLINACRSRLPRSHTAACCAR